MNREQAAKNKISVLKGVRIRTLSLWIVAGTIHQRNETASGISRHDPGISLD